MKTLDIPLAVATRRHIWDSGFYFKYDNKHFNTRTPTPNIGYKYNFSYLDSDLVPRSGGLSHDNNIFYFSSFREIWVQ